MNKVIEIVSSIAIAISLGLLVSTQMQHPNMLYYIALLFIFFIGAIGLRYAYDPDEVKSTAFAIVHAIVINFEITVSSNRKMEKIRRDYSFMQRNRILYEEGLDIYYR